MFDIKRKFSSQKKGVSINYALCSMLYALCSMLLVSCGDVTAPAPPGGTRTDAHSVRPGQLKKVSYTDLPGWRDDDVRYALKAFRNTCRAKISYAGRVIPDRYLLEEKCQLMPSESADIPTVRAWFESHFQPYKVYNDDGGTKGTFTGYYSPVVNACRTQTARCSAPVMDTPTDGRNYKGVDSKTIVKNRIGRVIYWINPIDLQDMGSATLILEDGTRVKLNVASTNDLPFNGIGGQLMKRGIRPPDGYGMKSVRAYLKQNPALGQELVDNNPRYVYYRESPNLDVIGTMGIPISKIRTIAVDTGIYTLGMPMFIDTYLSDNSKFQRLMIAQDTGGAIKGWIRADIFFGVGDNAFEYAQGQYSSGEMYLLMPKQYQYVKPSW
ncbi:MAG: MltA domain-containing protein [Proteobacteria bacterium]|nr:MltA domain-containing protein [Pseudomonadota bacterium]